MSKKAAVIGAGIAGLASAIRLACKGYAVDVFEKNSTPGGKISEIRQNDFRFDTGPSLFTLPQLVDELFTLCKKKSTDYFTYEQLEIICKYFFSNGNEVNAYRDSKKIADELETKTGESASHLIRYLHECHELYDLTADIFIFNSLHKWKNYLSSASLKFLKKFYTIDSFNTLHQRNCKSFDNKQVVQLFDRYATYNGSDPYQTPATLKVISHLEHNVGAFFPVKGMYSIVEALEQLAKEQGVVFHYNSLVEKIILDGNAVKGLKISDNELLFDMIVCDTDIRHVYTNLLTAMKIPPAIQKSEPSSSALIFYWCMNKTFPQLELHNILFSNDYKKEFDCLFKDKTIYDDPTVYIFISSKTAKQDAPSGCENWFVMINMPHNCGQDWDGLVSKARRDIIQKINSVLKIDVESVILSETFADPRSIEKNTLSVQGALYGNSSNNMLSAFNRHPNFKSKFKNLYFVGGSVHPGGGIPLCLASAAIIDKEIERLH